MKAVEAVDMCERCTTRKSTMIVMFFERGKGSWSEEMCIVCYDEKLESEKGGLSYRQWYQKQHGEAWTENHTLLDCFTDGYAAYCRDKGYEPYWDAEADDLSAV